MGALGAPEYYTAWGSYSEDFAAAAIDSEKGALRTPRSVMIAAMYLAGVTSKAGFSMPTHSGVTRRPFRWVTSRASRCSMGMSLPVTVSGSMVLNGADRKSVV